MAEALERAAGFVAQPVAGVLGNIELAGGIGRLAVAAGLVVGAGAVDGAVVLGDVEIDRPGRKLVVSFLIASSSLLLSFQS